MYGVSIASRSMGEPSKLSLRISQKDIAISQSSKNFSHNKKIPNNDGKRKTTMQFLYQ